MDRSSWADEVRTALTLTTELRAARTIGVQEALASVESALRAILEDPRRCDRRGTAAVLRLDIAELSDAMAWAAAADGRRLRVLVAKLEQFASRLRERSQPPIAA